MWCYLTENVQTTDVFYDSAVGSFLLIWTWDFKKYRHGPAYQNISTLILLGNVIETYLLFIWWILFHYVHFTFSILGYGPAATT